MIIRARRQLATQAVSPANHPSGSTPLTRNVCAITAALVVAVLASCSKASQDCDPTDPLAPCFAGGGAIDTIVVTSAIDSVMDVGGTAQMTGEARNAAGSPVTVTLAWTSLTTATATVNPSSGLVTAVAPGTTNIRASQSQNTVVGLYPMRVVDADLPLVTTLVGDTLADAMRQALTNTPRGALATILTNCATHRTSGNLLALNTCLSNAMSVSGGMNGNDNALLNVLDRFFDLAQRQLALN